MFAAFGINFTDLRQRCLKLYQGGFSQAVKNIFSFSNPYVAFGHGLHRKVSVNAEKLTWTGPDWTGLDRTGPDWTRLDRTGLDR